MTSHGLAKVAKPEKPELAIVEHSRAEEALRLNEARLDALVQLNQMTGASLQEITDFALEAAVRLTQSTIGYLAFLNEDETVLSMHSWSKAAMAECAIIDKPIVYPVVTTGLWGEAVRQRKPVITNDYQADNPLKKGYPQGHVQVLRHMNAPVFDGQRIVIVAGVGNKAAPYDDTDVRQLTLLMQGMWQLLQRRHSQQRLTHLNAVLRAVRNVNQLISREKSRDRLLEGACHCLVETRGCQQAWAVLLDPVQRPLAWAQAGFEHPWPLLVDRMRQGEPPPCIRQCLDKPGVAPVDERSCVAACCPLSDNCKDADTFIASIRHEGEIYGGLVVKLPQGFGDDPEERSLMQEVADDLGFALHGIGLEEQRALAEDQLRRQTAILRGINDVFQEAFTCLTDAEVAQKCLAVAEALTHSKFGFISEINERGSCDVIAMSDPGWRDCLIPESNAVRLLRDMEIRGIWGQVLKDNASLIINDPASHPARVGLPEGHPRLHSFLGVPLRHGAQTIGLVALANKDPGYDLADQHAVEALSVGFVEALMRKRAEQDLRKAHDQLESRVQQRTADLTRANAELEQARQAAEAASRAKSTFLANMSHEIRTPLNAVIGMTELVLKTQLSAQQREFLSTVKDSGEALLSVINDILDFSKIEAGKLVLDHATFDLRESLGDTMKSFAIRAHERGLELTCFIHPQVPHLVVGDYNRLRQILVNLVGNAIKFTESGEVGLEAALESRSQNDLVLHFTVSDTGIGIPEEKQSKIFEMFEQADSSMARRHGGTGLGLAIAARLVALMDGRIWLESRLGQGSRFHFIVHLSLAQGEPPQPAPPEPGCVHGMRVLVVDDNSTNRRILEEVLGSWKMAPVAASNAGEAIDLLRQAQRAGQPYQLVLTDAHMPRVDGFMLAEQVKQDPAISSTVIMMLTSGDRPEDLPRCGQLGIASYLLKPVKQSELLEAIELALGIAIPQQAPVKSAAQQPHHVSGLHVLLAEDSLVNQKLAVALLEGQGHRVALANNGREAVAATGAQPFDLVLMDVQMPEMDGLEAAARIRAREQQTGAHVPIIAMTAHALKGDRDRCLEAGMDNYVAKPIRAEELLETIDAVFAGRQGALPSASLAPPDLVNWTEALKTVHGNHKVLQAMAEAALEEIPQLIAAARQAVAARDYTKLRLAAHTLRGSVRYFGAERLCEHAAELEEMGRRGELAEPDFLLDTLDAEAAVVTAALSDYLQKTRS